MQHRFRQAFDKCKHTLDRYKKDNKFIANPDDRPLTTKFELMGWILFDFASSVWPSVAVNVLVPLILVNMTQLSGRQPYTDTPCAIAYGDQYIYPNGSSIGSGISDQQKQCQIDFMGFSIPTISYVLYVSSASVLLQVFAFLSFGALADYGRLRKHMLVICSTLGALCCIAFALVQDSSHYAIIAGLYIVANVVYGLSIVFYNAYLPLLIQNHPFIRGNLDKIVDIEELEDHLTLFGVSRTFKRKWTRTQSLWSRVMLFIFQNKKMPTRGSISMNELHVLSQGQQHNSDILTQPAGMHGKHLSVDTKSNHAMTMPIGRHSTSTEVVVEIPVDTERQRIKFETRLHDRVSNVLSTHGLAAGQFGALMMIFVSIAIIQFGSGNGKSAYPMQICVAICGIWWLVLSNFTWFGLKARPGPNFPKEVKNVVWFSWKKTFYAVRHYKKLPNTFLYLICYLLFSDAFTTIGQIAILFADNVVGMTSPQIAAALVLAAVAALCGSYFWLAISRKFRWSTQKALTVVLLLALLLPIYGMLGFIESGKGVTVIDGSPPITLGFGLKTSFEVYIAVIFLGSLLGGIQSFGRVLFSDLVPRGHESEFFSLYEVGDRGSSFIGPLIVGAIANASSGNVRFGFIYVILTLVLPIALMVFCLDVAKGKLECERFVIEEFEQLQATKGSMQKRQKIRETGPDTFVTMN